MRGASGLREPPSRGLTQPVRATMRQARIVALLAEPIARAHHHEQFADYVVRMSANQSDYVFSNDRLQVGVYQDRRASAPVFSAGGRRIAPCFSICSRRLRRCIGASCSMWHGERFSARRQARAEHACQFLELRSLVVSPAVVGVRLGAERLHVAHQIVGPQPSVDGILHHRPQDLPQAVRTILILYARSHQLHDMLAPHARRRHVAIGDADRAHFLAKSVMILR